MKRKQLKIEEILEQIGAQEIPGDPDHRYELRRALLCSRYFGSTCNKQSRWEVLMSYTAPLVAGSVVVGVFAFMATSISTSEMLNPGSVSVEVVVADEFKNNTTAFESNVNAAMFLSDPSESFVQLADFEEFTEKYNVMRFVPATSQMSVMVR